MDTKFEHFTEEWVNISNEERELSNARTKLKTLGKKLKHHEKHIDVLRTNERLAGPDNKNLLEEKDLGNIYNEKIKQPDEKLFGYSEAIYDKLDQTDNSSNNYYKDNINTNRNGYNDKILWWKFTTMEQLKGLNYYSRQL